MAVDVIELFKSREGVESLDSPSAVLLYVVTGTDNDVDVRLAIEAQAPSIYVGLPIQDYDFRPLGNQIWEAAVHYGLKKQTNENSFSFDTGGGTAHVSQSISTIARYPATATDCEGEIGVSGDSVDGVDITVPVYNFTETHYLPAVRRRHPSESTPSHSESTSLSQSESTSPPSSESSSEGSESDSGSLGSDESFSGSLSRSEGEIPL